MTSGQKIAFSLLTAMVLFAGFFVVSQTSVFEELETRYYSQAKIREKVESLDNISENFDSYITNFLSYVSDDTEEKTAFLNTAAVASYADANNPSEELVAERRRLTESLFTEYEALKGLRIIDKNGRFVHYSSFDSTDVLRQTGITKYYKFYSDIIKDADELEFSSVAINETSLENRIFIDSSKNRLVMSFPLRLRDIFQASAVFYFDLHEIQKSFVDSNVISIGQNLTAFSDTANGLGGLVINVPVKYYDDFSGPILDSWSKPASKQKLEEEISSLLQVQPEKILEIDDGRFWMLISSRKSEFVKIGGVYTSDIFELSDQIKYLIYIAVGLSIFLIAFLLFSLKTDKKVVIKRRIKKIQYSIISEYLDNKEKIEWKQVVNQLKSRKNDLSGEILKSAGVKSKRKAEKLKLDEFLEQSWEQIFAVIAPEVVEEKTSTKVTTNAVAGISIEDLRRVIEEVLQGTKLNVQVDNISEVPAVKKATKKKPVAPVVEDIEEIEEVEELSDDVEEIEEVEELADDVEEIEEVEELSDDVEEIEEVEELSDDVEEIEEVEELADDVEEIEEVEELADDVEEIEEVEELSDDVEEIEEVEELADDVEEIEEVEELSDDVEEFEEVEELADDVDEIIDVDDFLDAEEEIVELSEFVDDVVELEEITAPSPAPKADTLALVQALGGSPQYRYKKANNSFIRNEEFANVENLFAEELTVGCEYIVKTNDSNFIDFVAEPYTYKFDSEEEVVLEEESVVQIEEATALDDEGELVEESEVVEEDIAIVDEVEDLEEPAISSLDNSEILADELEELDDSEMFITNDYFAMTQFGANTNNIQELESATESIVESDDGVFSIADNLEYTDVVVDPDFKNLVDSVLR